MRVTNSLDLKDEPVGKAGTEGDVADLGKRLLGNKGTGTVDHLEEW